MTLGEKLKFARKNAGLTQEQLAEKLLVSRQAVTKWEADKGMPDIENLKRLSKLLNISIDFLLDSEENIDLSVIREEINLDDYTYVRKFKGRWNKKAGKKNIFLNGIKNADKEFYLVNQSDKQFFIIVTDEFIESRQLAEKITDKRFSIGNFSFVDCGIISDFKHGKK